MEELHATHPKKFFIPAEDQQANQRTEGEAENNEDRSHSSLQRRWMCANCDAISSVAATSICRDKPAAVGLGLVCSGFTAFQLLPCFQITFTLPATANKYNY